MSAQQAGCEMIQLAGLIFMPVLDTVTHVLTVNFQCECTQGMSGGSITVEHDGI